MKKAFLILALLSFASLTISAQTQYRIIRVSKADADETTYLEITSLKIGNGEINFNEPFAADENWLKNIKIKLKNISGKSITCAGVGFGLLEGIDQELEPQMSWGYGLGLSRGNCSSLDKKKDDRKFILKSNEEIELTYADADSIYHQVLEKFGIGKFCKAKLTAGTVKFKKGGFKNSYLRVSSNVRYFDEDEN